jgi:hypothetical protein
MADFLPTVYNWWGEVCSFTGNELHSPPSLPPSRTNIPTDWFEREREEGKVKNGFRDGGKKEE